MQRMLQIFKNTTRYFAYIKEVQYLKILSLSNEKFYLKGILINWKKHFSKISNNFLSSANSYYLFA